MTNVYIPDVVRGTFLSQIRPMFISQMWNVQNVEIIFFRMVTSQNKQKGFALYCYHFANLEGHAVHALFSPVMAYVYILDVECSKFHGTI